MDRWKQDIVPRLQDACGTVSPFKTIWCRKLLQYAAHPDIQERMLDLDERDTDGSLVHREIIDMVPTAVEMDRTIFSEMIAMVWPGG